MQIDAQQAQAIISIINALSLGVVAVIHAWRASTKANGLPVLPGEPVPSVATLIPPRQEQNKPPV
jgi:hypothetical protein